MKKIQTLKGYTLIEVIVAIVGLATIGAAITIAVLACQALYKYVNS